jgi:hypothetical protein
MTAQFFIDTNVLLYCGSNAIADQAKRQIARQLLAQPAIGFSAQVLQEFYVAAVTKQKLQMTHAVFVRSDVRTMAERNDVLEGIRKAAASLRRPPSRSEFIASTGITEYHVLSHFPSWREAVRAAGLTPEVFSA